MEGPWDSLAALHAAVPAAEALDLSEQAWLDRMAARFEELAAQAMPPPAADRPASGTAPHGGETAAGDELTPGQMLGLLEHQLGATVIEE